MCVYNICMYMYNNIVLKYYIFIETRTLSYPLHTHHTHTNTRAIEDLKEYTIVSRLPAPDHPDSTARPSSTRNGFFSYFFIRHFFFSPYTGNIYFFPTVSVSLSLSLSLFIIFGSRKWVKKYCRSRIVALKLVYRLAAAHTKRRKTTKN